MTNVDEVVRELRDLDEGVDHLEGGE